jgi:hypothetical protein
MKRIVVLLLVAAVVAGVGFADPIGLTAKIDSFSFGNVAAENYEFAGTNGLANITPGLDYAKTFGAFKLGAGLQDTFTFKDPLKQKLRLHVKGTYALQLAEASKLSFSVYDKFFLEGADDKFADVDTGQVYDYIGPGIRFDQTLDFGSIYAIAEVNFNINFQESKKVAVGSGDDDGFKVGADAKFGLYGYIQPAFTFTNADGSDVKDVLTSVNFRVGYKITPSLDARVTVDISTIENGFKTAGKGLRIRPRVTYSNIIPGLGAYADFDITGIGVESPGKVGFTPSIGVTYAF